MKSRPCLHRVVRTSWHGWIPFLKDFLKYHLIAINVPYDCMIREEKKRLTDAGYSGKLQKCIIDNFWAFGKM